MNIPHYLTITRILIGPLFLLFYMGHSYLDISDILLPYILLFLLVICELSDAMDGFFARKYNQVTELGKVLDPMADSIARLSLFLTFTLEPVKLPLPIVFIFLYRDSIISTLRTVCAMKGFTLAARTSGKIKAVVQAIAAFIVVILMIPHSLGYISTDTLQSLSTTVVTLAALYTIYSGLEYFSALRDLRDSVP